MRTAIAIVTGGVVAALGALILGEYPFTGLLVVAAGVILGLLLAEAFLAVSHQPGRPAAAACAGLTAVSLLWGGWISTGHDLGLLAAEGWVAVAAGAAAAGVRAGWRRAAGSRPASAPEP